MRCHIIIKSVRSSTEQLEYSFRSKLMGFQIIFFENFEIFSDSFSITISYPKILIPFIWRKSAVPCRRVTLPAERKKKTLTPTSLHACSNRLTLAMRALYRYGSELIWSVGPKCPLPFDKIIFPRNADLYPAYKHDNQTRSGFCLVCATGPFHWARGFSEKRVKCFWRIVGPARSLTLPLQKGDWTRWVSLPAETTFGKLPLMRPALGHKILVVI